MKQVTLFPRSIEAEEGLLGSLLIDPDVAASVIDVVRPDDFYRDAHQTIYEAILRLYTQHIPADFITICEELERENKLEDVGGASALMALVNYVPTSANAIHYASIVAQKALYRRLIHLSGEMAAWAYSEETDALEKAEQALFALSTTGKMSDPVPISEVMASCLRDLSLLQTESRALIGVPTGFPLDVPLGGLQRGDLIILAARPGVGKTAFALNIAANTAYEHDRRVAIFSLEMSKEALGLRLLSGASHVDQMRLRMGRVEDEEWIRLEAQASLLIRGPIWIDDTGGLSLASLRSRARRLKVAHGIDLLIVDYLQLMHAELSGKRYPNREQEIAEISRGLKALARELDIPVLALAQLSRAVEGRMDKRPQLSDLRESGAIENDADVVLFIYREELYNPENLDARNTADIVIAKHRNGPVGTVRLGFDARETRFYTIDFEPQEE
jgi:replicative DNA helicase